MICGAALSGFVPGLAGCGPATQGNNPDRTSRCTTRGRCRRYRTARTRSEHIGPLAPGQSAIVWNSSEETAEVRRPKEIVSAPGRRGQQVPTRPPWAGGSDGQFASSATHSNLPRYAMKLLLPADRGD